MVTSAVQAQGRQDAQGIHLPSDSTRPFLERRKVPFQHCEPNSYHGIKVMQLCLGSALMYTAQYSPGMGVTSSALKHMHIYVREKNLI